MLQKGLTQNREVKNFIKVRVNPDKPLVFIIIHDLT
jgi:hypothetical protein